MGVGVSVVQRVDRGEASQYLNKGADAGRAAHDPQWLPDTQAVHKLTDTVKQFRKLVAPSWQSRRHDVVKTLLAAILAVLVAQTGLFYYGLLVYPYVDVEDENTIYRGTDTE